MFLTFKTAEVLPAKLLTEHKCFHDNNNNNKFISVKGI